jgi:circadian clock protein KaiC
MAHSNQVREFVITPQGVSLIEPYLGGDGVLTGTARIMQEQRDATAARERELERLRAERLLERKHALLEQRIAELRAEFAAEEVELLARAKAAADLEAERLAGRVKVGMLRGVSNGASKSQARSRRN